VERLATPAAQRTIVPVVRQVTPKAALQQAAKQTPAARQEIPKVALQQAAHP
jgi:hypothetical protein